MANGFYAFGEILWDWLPSGRHSGGAPFNVAAHLAQLGARASLISAVGEDELGAQLLQVARDKQVRVRFVSRARPGLATGTADATVDADGNATYVLLQPAAWDEISVSDEALAALATADALTFGSLAARSRYNLEQLDRLLSVSGPLKFFDVNLRPPFVDMDIVLELGKRADIIKLNDDELTQLASWLLPAEATLNRSRSSDGLAETCAVVAEATGVNRICVTRANEGAALWDHGTLTAVPAPRVVVKDTVGAGDAFMAGLMLGVTRGSDTMRVLANACELGAYVASHHGATPPLPAELVARFRGNRP